MRESTLSDVSAKQAYEWVKTHHWDKRRYVEWLTAKKINPDKRWTTSGGITLHRANGQLSYEWIKTRKWTFSVFRHWLNSFL